MKPKKEISDKELDEIIEGKDENFKVHNDKWETVWEIVKQLGAIEYVNGLLEGRGIKITWLNKSLDDIHEKLFRQLQEGAD